MSREDWYRKSTWSDSDAQDFSTRLNRSRSAFHKSQYLRIQAYVLAETRDRKLVRSALQLLERLFSEFPERSELSAAHIQAANCHELLGNRDKAIEHFQLAIEAQDRYPHSDSGVSIDYPWFVVRHNLTDRYTEAIELLERANPIFPVAQFKVAAIRAFVADALGHDSASRHAKWALDSAAMKQSQFRYHRDLGLVGKEFEPFIKRLRAIAAA